MLVSRASKLVSRGTRVRWWMAACLICAPGLAVAADFEVRPGRWRVEVAVPEGGAMVSYHTCVRTRQAREAFKFLPNIINPELQCHQVEFTVEPGMVRWMAQCEAPVKVDARVDINYREEELVGVTRVWVNQGKEQVQTAQLIRAKRVGECD